MRNILVVDDDPDIRTALKLLLKKAGYEAETASGKEEAFNKIEVFRPCVILLDILLSGFDGRSICKQIKASVLTRHIPVIMFSAHPSAIGNIESYGADDFISKPVSTEKLLATISRQFNMAAS